VNANPKIFFPHFDELLSERHPDGPIPQNVGVLHEFLPERRAGRPSRKSALPDIANYACPTPVEDEQSA
jgi:hypothetical protein